MTDNAALIADVRADMDSKGLYALPEQPVTMSMWRSYEEARALKEMPRAEAASTITDFDNRIAANASSITGLSGQITSTNNLVTSLQNTGSAQNDRIVTIENRFTTGKAASIAPVSGNTPNDVVTVAGVSVAVGLAFMTLAGTVAELKTKFNLHLAASKSWGWMAT